MSRRPEIIEEFDDETDLPLPSRPLPNTGMRGAIIQELSDDEDSGDDNDDNSRPGGQVVKKAPAPGPASPSHPQSKGPTPAERAAFGDRMITDITPYKS